MNNVPVPLGYNIPLDVEELPNLIATYSSGSLDGIIDEYKEYQSALVGSLDVQGFVVPFFIPTNQLSRNDVLFLETLAEFTCEKQKTIDFYGVYNSSKNIYFISSLKAEVGGRTFTYDFLQS